MMLTSCCEMYHKAHRVISLLIVQEHFEADKELVVFVHLFLLLGCGILKEKG